MTQVVEATSYSADLTAGALKVAESRVVAELFAKFQTSFYADPADAVFKAIGVQ